MIDLSTAGESFSSDPAYRPHLSVDRVKFIQEDVADCQIFLSVSLFISSTYL